MACRLTNVMIGHFDSGNPNGNLVFNRMLTCVGQSNHSFKSSIQFASSSDTINDTRGVHTAYLAFHSLKQS